MSSPLAYLSTPAHMLPLSSLMLSLPVALPLSSLVVPLSVALLLAVAIALLL